jgi:hypothetical protein
VFVEALGDDPALVTDDALGGLVTERCRTAAA